MKLGFIGSGAIASAIITGLSSDQTDRPPILLLPRNADISAQLASRFSNVRVAATNQAVLEGSDVVMLTVRPQIARDALSELRFRRDRHVISLIATLSLETVSALIAPARRITRAVPLPSVAYRRGPTPIYPPDRRVADLFGALGGAIEVRTAGEFDTFCTATVSIASYFTFAETVASWLARHDVPAAEARRYVAGVFQGSAETTRWRPKRVLWRSSTNTRRPEG